MVSSLAVAWRRPSVLGSGAPPQGTPQHGTQLPSEPGRVPANGSQGLS